jgi:hypothetical protein
MPPTKIRSFRGSYRSVYFSPWWLIHHWLHVIFCSDFILFCSRSWTSMNGLFYIFSFILSLIIHIIRQRTNKEISVSIYLVKYITLVHIHLIGTTRLDNVRRKKHQYYHYHPAVSLPTDTDAWPLFSTSGRIDCDYYAATLVVLTSKTL